MMVDLAPQQLLLWLVLETSAGRLETVRLESAADSWGRDARLAAAMSSVNKCMEPMLQLELVMSVIRRMDVWLVNARDNLLDKLIHK